MAMNKQILIFIALGMFLNLKTQSQSLPKFWIKLTDKAGTPYSISTPTAFLTQKAVQRRINQGIAIDVTDLPVNPAYISQIAGVSNVNLLYASKWLNAVAISINSSSPSVITTATNAISTFSFVQSSEPVNRFQVVYDNEMDVFSPSELNKTTSANSPSYYGPAYWQTKQINADCIHGYGYRGQGMVIAVLDAGFRNVDVLAAFDSLRARNGILGTRDFVSGGNSVYEDHSHGTNVLSCMAALLPGTMVGTAPRADYWLFRTEDVATETPSEEYNWIRGAEFADSVGADMLTTSLGYTTFDNINFNHTYSGLNGKTYPMSIVSTMAVRKGMFVLNSAGNDGNNSWTFVGVPADADSICSVGAIDTNGVYASFSSKGPTVDGRIKPDLVARGHRAYVATQSGGYAFGNGTSFSCPVLAGGIACFWQRHSHLTAYQVLDTLRKTASNNANPNNNIGWGIPNMCALPVGIQMYSANQPYIDVYPNPFSSNVNLTIPNGIGTEFKILVMDVAGKIVYSNTLKNESGTLPLNLEKLERGIYFIHLQSAQFKQTQKLIKE